MLKLYTNQDVSKRFGVIVLKNKEDSKRLVLYTVRKANMRTEMDKT